MAKVKQQPHYRQRVKKVAQIRIAGPDRKGIIATITQFLFSKGCNIEDIDQRILDDFLVMTLQVNFSDLSDNIEDFTSDLLKTAKKVGCTAEFKPIDKTRLKNVVLLVSREAHCLEDLINNFKKKKLHGRIVAVIGNHETLKKQAEKAKLPFYYIASEKKKEHETAILEILEKLDVDLIVLARYMQILSPEFVFKYEGRIINIHPSLLPAFPGPRAYHQAYHRGVEVVGVTAHFVTTNLDEGPIITQDSFRIDKTCTELEEVIRKGREKEAIVLTQAVKLFLEDRLILRRGKVLDNKKAPLCDINLNKE